MESGELIGLADELQEHLKRGELTNLGTIDLGPDGIWDAERVTRIMLADVTHCLQDEARFSQVPGASREDLAQQLRCLDEAIHSRLGECPSFPFGQHPQ